ncbi:hypothetical protein NC651_038137 [Populus alba x Populus x berolinensis]|nr:hypothetical protein NC651_038137 [Populus alba x Populus x berolinensis]
MAFLVEGQEETMHMEFFPPSHLDTAMPCPVNATTDRGASEQLLLRKRVTARVVEGPLVCR